MGRVSKVCSVCCAGAWWITCRARTRRASVGMQDAWCMRGCDCEGARGLPLGLYIVFPQVNSCISKYQRVQRSTCIESLITKRLPATVHRVPVRYRGWTTPRRSRHLASRNPPSSPQSIASSSVSSGYKHSRMIRRVSLLIVVGVSGFSPR